MELEETPYGSHEVVVVCGLSAGLSGKAESARGGKKDQGNVLKIWVAEFPYMLLVPGPLLL